MNAASALVRWVDGRGGRAGCQRTLSVTVPRRTVSARPKATRPRVSHNDALAEPWFSLHRGGSSVPRSRDGIRLSGNSVPS